MAARDDLPCRTLDELVNVVRAFLDPMLAGTTGRCDPKTWGWRSEGDRLEPDDAESGWINRRDNALYNQKRPLNLAIQRAFEDGRGGRI